jgi:geranylgeranyl diphosphate synthase type II
MPGSRDIAGRSGANDSRAEPAAIPNPAPATAAHDAPPWLFAPLARIERALEAALARAHATPALRAAMEYATLGPGKRLRPILAWHCCEALGTPGERSLPAGVAIELVHCFSLVHDDLPALDNDDLRRGKPTLHKHAGEAMAILAGDALLTRAFDLLASDAWAALDADAPPASDPLRVALLARLARATGAMIAGQVADTLHDYPADLATPDQRLRFVHRSKTGAMIAASCSMGAACATAHATHDPAHTRAIDTYGDALGLLFQAVDDLVDVTQSSDHAGKRTGKDAAAGKLTFPALYGVDRTRELVARLRDDACDAATPLSPQAQYRLRSIATHMAERTR